MHEDERWTLDPVQGRRAPSSSGERAAVGLGVFLVLVAAIIGVANMAGIDVRLQLVGPTPSAQPDPARTARPTPSARPLREIALELGTPAPEPRPYASRSAWVRALADLPILTTPVSANAIGTVLAGEAVLVELADEDEPGAHPGWAQIVDPGPYGWVDVSDPERAEVVEHWWWEPTAEVWRLTAGGDSFVALGTGDEGLLHARRQSLLVSTDGAEWRRSPAPQDREWGGMAAYGPAGWLMAVEDGQGSVWISQSEDGISWEWLGGLTETGNGYPIDFTGSADGYALLFMDWQVGTVRPWFSTDGIWWREGADPGLETYPSGRITALLDGYLVWSGWGLFGGPGPGDVGYAAFSVDGRAWQEVTDGPTGINPQVAGEPALAIDADPTTGETRVWRGDRSSGRLVWSRDEQAERTFAGSAVSTLAAHGQQAWAFGWDRRSQETQAWAFDGSAWRRMAVPDGLEAPPRLLAAGPAGVVAAGGVFGERGLHPGFWHLGTDGQWHPEQAPVYGAPPVIDRAGCGPAPDDLLEVMVLDAAMAVACHGDRDLTFRAWSSSCDGCYYRGNGTYQPAWLVAPTDNQLHLGPFRSDGGPWATAVLPPDIEPRAEWRDAWLEVTAHYDDPAAATCRTDPAADEIAWWLGPQAVIDQCRRTLVVSEVRVLEPGELHDGQEP